MNEYESIINQIHIKHDLISSFLFSGLFLGILLSLVILTKNHKKFQPLYLLNSLIILIIITNADFYLCYTGLVKFAPWIFNSTEIAVLLIGPIFFFFLQSLLTGKKISIRKKWMHLMLPIFYFFTQIGYHVQNNLVKLNYYLDAYNLSNNIKTPSPTDWLYLSQLFNNFFIWLVIGSAIVYAILSFDLIRKYRFNLKKTNNNSFTDKEAFSRNLIILFTITFFVVFVIFFSSENDQKEYIVGLTTTFVLYIVAFFVLHESQYFNSSWLFEKYRTSGLNTRTNEIFQKTNLYLKESQYYLNNDCSLPNLSKQLTIPANYISQSIHESTGKNFNEFINELRVEVSKERLTDADFKHLNLDGIGTSVGFNSKTSFYNSFKKCTGMTPAQYIKTYNS